MKKLISSFMIMAMLFTLLIAVPTSSAAGQTDCLKTTEVSSWEELKAELEKNNSTNETIVLTQDLSCPDIGFDNSIRINKNATIVLDMNGHSINFDSYATNTMFYIYQATSLHIVNSDIDALSTISFCGTKYMSDNLNQVIFYMDNSKAEIYTYNINYVVNNVRSNTTYINDSTQTTSVFSVLAGDIHIMGGRFTNYYRLGNILSYIEGGSANNLSVAGDAVLESGNATILLHKDTSPNKVELLGGTFKSIDTRYYTGVRIKEANGKAVLFSEILGKTYETNKTPALSTAGSNAELNTSSNINNTTRDVRITTTTLKNQMDSDKVYTSIGHIKINTETHEFVTVAPHNMFDDIDTEIEPNCNTPGRESDMYCLECPYKIIGRTLINGHYYIGWIVEKSATTTSNGLKVTYCDDCNNPKTATINRIAAVFVPNTTYTYNGKAQKPKVTAVDSKGSIISSDCYKVTYKNNKSVGTATATVNFGSSDKETISPYKGTVRVSFRIVPKGTSVSKTTPLKKSFKVTVKKQTSQTTGYQVQYSTKSNFASAKTVKISNKTTSTTIKNLKAKTKYYVRVRTYKTVNKKTYTSAWSSKMTVKTK